VHRLYDLHDPAIFQMKRGVMESLHHPHYVFPVLDRPAVGEHIVNDAPSLWLVAVPVDMFEG
jgi:hypothetical protein